MKHVNVRLSPLKVTTCFFLVSLCACQNFQSLVTPRPATPIASPVFTDEASATTDNQTEIDLVPLPRSEEYIIYSKYETNIDYSIWAINPNNPVPIFVTSNSNPRNWSPTNKFWLFTAFHSIYIANADGSGIHPVYAYKGYEGIEPFWLTDNILLFNAYKDTVSLPPDIYSLDVSSGVATQLFLESDAFVQTTFPSEGKWLQASWPSGRVDIIDQNGYEEVFFDGFSIPTNIFAPYPPIQWINKLNKYIFKAIGPDGTGSKLWLASKQEIPQVFFDPGNDGIDQFEVSPNEQYVALTYNTLNGVYVYIFDLESHQLLHSWDYPYQLGAGYFIWSPDSQSIALHYSESDIGMSEVTMGIQIMNIVTGETQVILNEDVTRILFWHYIE